MATFQTRDGLALRLTDWPVAQPRARMLLVHGLGEHSGRYAAVAGDLNALGISVRAFDHRGHGKSGGRRGVNGKDADCLSRDTLELFESYAAEGSDLPFLFGHSMGGLVAMHAVGKLGLRPRGLIASSPALASHAGRFDRLLSKVLLRLAPDMTVANGLPPTSCRMRRHRACLPGRPDNHNRVSARWHNNFDAVPEVIAPRLLERADLAADRWQRPPGGSPGARALCSPHPSPASRPTTTLSSITRSTTRPNRRAAASWPTCRNG